MWFYNTGIAIYETAIKTASAWYPKAELWSDGRKGMFDRLRRAVGSEARIVWIHAASLGEFEQGRPIIEKIREERPEYRILVTFFSPSGYEIRKNYAGADWVSYLPSDSPTNVRRFLDIVNPEIAIFVKAEFWLNMLGELRRRKTRTYLVSAVFRRKSVFFRPYGGIWRDALETYDTLFVQNEESKTLLSELGYSNVVVAGDTRFDRVAKIAANAERIAAVEKFKGGKRLFVAGSTWRPDEEILRRLIDDNPDIKFIVAPHEMDEQRIAKILNGTAGGAVRYTQATDEALTSSQVLVLDTVGLLASVYGYADWAYIGGGFGVGIHNTLEAATFGLPVAFGPNYKKFREACDLVALGAAESVDSYEALKAWFAPLRDDADRLAEASRIAKEYTTKHQGATDIFVDTIFSQK